MGRKSKMAEGLTMQDLAGRISKKFGLEPAKVARILQTWISAGVVLPDGDIHQGPGIYRTFQKAELYRAALIFPLARHSLPIHQLQCVRRLMDQGLKKAPNVFEHALRGQAWYFHYAILPVVLVNTTDPKATANWGKFLRKPYDDKPWGKWFDFGPPGEGPPCFDSHFTIRVDYVLKGL